MKDDLNGGINLDKSILQEVRVACNVDENDTGFDLQLIPLINTQLMLAHQQLGIGPESYSITGVNETWGDWLGEPGPSLVGIKTWVGYSVLLMFDPPDNSTVLKSYQDTISKLEWMLSSKSRLEGHSTRSYPVSYDYPKYEDEAGNDEDDD